LLEKWLIVFFFENIAALHALKLDRVRRWDEEQAQEIATEEHGWLK
jgi:hypothetical protein